MGNMTKVQTAIFIVTICVAISHAGIINSGKLGDKDTTEKCFGLDCPKNSVYCKKNVDSAKENASVYDVVIACLDKQGTEIIGNKTQVPAYGLGDFHVNYVERIKKDSWFSQLFD